MRVDYTMPALQPATFVDTPTTGEGGAPSFRDQLRGVASQIPVSWEQQLRLDARPYTGTFIGPPPRPRSLDLRDAETERSHWRNMVWRHGQASDASGSQPSSSSHSPVHVMLDMLRDMQQMEDSIVSQSAALTRG
jgi:hypothetical protein